ncbi:MAG: hypothetical protein ACOH1Y_09950 [Propionicimonas sp.]
MSVDTVSTTVDPAGVPVETLAGLPASLGAVGYAAFALLQPIPLHEIVPFSTVVAAFRAEADLMADGPAPQVDVVPVPAPVDLEPVQPYAENGYRSAPVFDENVGPVRELEVAPNDTVLREVAALGELTPVEPEAEVEAEPVPVVQVFSAGGYASSGDSGDSRARQVLDELSFLFDSK